MSSNRQSERSALSCAAVLGALGMIFLAHSFYAQLTHDLVPAGRPGAPPMSPQQGYFVSLLFFAVAAYALFLAYRAHRKNDD
jgi:hypothetical protein